MIWGKCSFFRYKSKWVCQLRHTADRDEWTSLKNSPDCWKLSVGRPNSRTAKRLMLKRSVQPRVMICVVSHNYAFSQYSRRSVTFAPIFCYSFSLSHSTDKLAMRRTGGHPQCSFADAPNLTHNLVFCVCRYIYKIDRKEWLTSVSKWNHSNQPAGQPSVRWVLTGHPLFICIWRCVAAPIQFKSAAGSCS